MGAGAAVLPAGAQISVLEGNPAEKGPVTLRLNFPANYNIPPHWHSMTERVTVLSGALHVGMGDKLDRQASQTLEPGGFVSLPAKMHHFAWTGHVRPSCRSISKGRSTSSTSIRPTTRKRSRAR